MNPEMLENIHTEIKSQLKKFVDYANAKNYDGLMECLTDDAIVITDQGKFEGYDNIKALYTDVLAPVTEGEIFSKRIYPVGDKIYEIGTNRMVLMVDGKEVEIKGNYVSIWKKENGQWKLSEDLLPPTPE